MEKKTCLPAAIDVKQVSKRFRDVQAVDQVSFHVCPGELIGLLGPNGAGKTTLVEMIEGLQKPDQGVIELFGLTWRRHPRYLRRRIGLSLQENRFIDKLTTEEVLSLFGSFHNASREWKETILRMVHLEEKRKTFTVHLSGGQRQKLALGVAMIGRPQILLLDEPTIGLDPVSRQEIWQILQELKRQGTTMILTTHYMDEAEILSDRIFIMHQGRFLDQGTLPDLQARHGKGDIIEFHLTENHHAPRLDELPEVLHYEWDPAQARGRVTVRDIARTLPEFFRMAERASLRIQTLEYHRSTLNDLFISLTGRELHD